NTLTSAGVGSPHPQCSYGAAGRPLLGDADIARLARPSHLKSPGSAGIRGRHGTLNGCGGAWARMTADTTCERLAAIEERRVAYEAEVTDALLDETQAERAERLELVRLAQEMILQAFRLCEEPAEQ